MARDETGLPRRRFLQGLAAGALLGSGCRSSRAEPRRSEADPKGALAARPRVVVVRARKTLIRGYDADRAVLRAMLAAGLAALSGDQDPARAITRYVRPGERVGLKINGLAARQAATHVELVDELSALLVKAGIAGERQIAFDRFKRDLIESGFGVGARSSYRCLGNDEAGHETEIAQMPSSASRLSRVLTRQVDGVINLPVLKQHMLAGMTGALKNNFGCIHNPNKMHIDRCDPFVAEVNAIPAIRTKQRLVIMDALRPVVEKGPAYQPGAGEVANRLLFATDPVAVDTVGLGILAELRAKRGLGALDREELYPAYLDTAAKLGLGVRDRARIEVVTVEV